MTSSLNLSRRADPPGVDSHAQPQVGRESVALPRWLVSSALYGVVVVDCSAKVVFANETFARSLGYSRVEKLIGRDLRRHFAAREEDWKLWQGGGVHRLRLRNRDSELATWTCEVTVSQDSLQQPLYHSVLCPQEEYSETGRLLEHAARMEAVAGMSSGVAHDFNNLLTVLVGNLFLLGEDLRDNEAAFARIKAARDSALRGAELTRQLLNYARGGDNEDEAEVRPASVVQRLVPLLERLVGSRIELHTDLKCDDSTVNASRGQLESAIVNLVINARDAIDGAGAITIGVHASRCEKTGDDRLVVSVGDDGPGMPEDVMNRVFEPFFTTKGDGRGTGLGLSMVRWFAESVNGGVRIDTESGTGTTVSIELPMAGSGVGDTTCSKTLPLSVLPSGDERIALLIDDSEVRAMTQQTLAVLGYDVELVSTGDMAGAASAAGKFDLAVIDTDDGPEMIALVDELHSHASMRVLALTARSIAELDERFQLRKPFSLVELAGVVRGVLDGEPASG